MSVLYYYCYDMIGQGEYPTRPSAMTYISLAVSDGIPLYSKDNGIFTRKWIMDSSFLGGTFGKNDI